VAVFRSSVRVLCVAGSLALLVALPLAAQDRGVQETKAAIGVPQSAQPPAGLCRVWLENVPASRQPAPTDCATAIKNRPNNARIVFGNLSEEAARPAQKAASAPSDQRTNGWPTRLNNPQRRFDASPGVPNRPPETRQNEGAAGVRPVSATMPVTRPTSDSGPKRRP
jgi:hypothetical protein